jgi:hypothetical protein
MSAHLRKYMHVCVQDSRCMYAGSVGINRPGVKSTYMHILHVYAHICKYMNVYDSERIMVYKTENAHFAVSLPLSVGCTPLYDVSWSASVRC